jgi:hypothetical protein
MIPIEWWTSTETADALGCYVWQAACEGETGATPQEALQGVRAMCAALPSATRSRVVLDALDDGWWAAQALDLATRLCAERDQARASAPPVRRYSVALVSGAIGSAIRETLTPTWGELSRLLTDPVKWAGEKVTAPAWLPVSIRDGAPRVRKDVNVSAVSCMVLDIDEGSALADVVARVKGHGYRAALHTTWSHSPGQHKARVVFPFAEDCPADRWAEVWRCADQWAKGWGATIDASCKNPARLYFLPALPADEWRERRSWFRGEVFEGEAMRWRWLLAYHQPPAPAAPPAPPPVRGWGGATGHDLDRETRRRRGYAVGVLRSVCEELSVEGNRNPGCFKAGAKLAGLVLAGVMGEDEGKATILAAAMGAGLSQTEATTAMNNGYRAGETEGAWDFSTLS